MFHSSRQYLPLFGAQEHRKLTLLWLVRRNFVIRLLLFRFIHSIEMLEVHLFTFQLILLAQIQQFVCFLFFISFHFSHHVSSALVNFLSDFLRFYGLLHFLLFHVIVQKEKSEVAKIGLTCFSFTFY